MTAILLTLSREENLRYEIISANLKTAAENLGFVINPFSWAADLEALEKEGLIAGAGGDWARSYWITEDGLKMAATLAS